MKVRVIKKGDWYYPQYKRFHLFWKTYISPGYNHMLAGFSSKEAAVKFIKDQERQIVSEFEIKTRKVT